MSALGELIRGGHFRKANPTFLNPISLALIALSLGAPPSHARWSDSDRSDFQRGCVAGCTKQIGQPDACQRMCTCVLSEYETNFPDYDKVDAARAAKNPEVMRRLDALRSGCVQRERQKYGPN